MANPYVPPQTLKAVLHHGAMDERIDLQIMISLLYHYKAIARAMGKPIAMVTPFRELADVIGDVAKETGKPIIVVLPNPKRGPEDLDVVEMLAQARQLLIEKGVPVFDEIRDAFRAVGHLNTYYGERGARNE